MSTRNVTLLGLGAIAGAALMSQIAFSAQEPIKLGALTAGEGIYVDKKGYQIVKGSAKGDPTPELTKMGAKEVTDGAIIVRVGEKLYLVDADPTSKSYVAGWAAEAFARGPGN